MMIIAQAASLGLTLWISSVTISRVYNNNSVSAFQFALCSAGVVSFVLSMGWLG